MTQATFDTIASDLDAQVSYLLRRCLLAEGKDPHDAEARVAPIADADAARSWGTPTGERR